MKKRFLSFVAGVLCACSIVSAATAPAAVKNVDAQLSIAQAAAVTKPGTVTGLKAVSAGKNRVKLTWTAVSGAQGYLVYGQKSGKYAYVGMTTQGTTFTDTNALDNDYNYYWVFAYVKDASGKMIPGGCQKYVFAKGICAAVTGLKAASTTAGVKLTWNTSATAAGYLIYGKTDSTSYGYKGMTTGLTWTDTKAPTDEISYYWVFPYHKDASGNMVVGGTASYVFGKKTLPVYTSYKVGDLSYKVLTVWDVEQDTFKGFPTYAYYSDCGIFVTSCQNLASAENAANFANKFGSLVEAYISTNFKNWGEVTVKTNKQGSSGSLIYADLELDFSDSDFICYGRLYFDTATGRFYEFMANIYNDCSASEIATYKKQINAVLASIRK
ncbi:MAG: hypothetical protein J6T40_07640 [Clostridiales bacterium]|nr:hypothetical protein [Clostridiales bacterium]MBR5937049.1 hypothetical protein [Clostridiales bacterium]